MISTWNITMRAECMRWTTGSKIPKRMIKLGMCEPKVKIELAMSTEQWHACRVYKLCCSACLSRYICQHFIYWYTKTWIYTLDGYACLLNWRVKTLWSAQKAQLPSCMSGIASFFSTSPNAHLFGYAGAKMTSLISMSTKLVHAEHAYKVHCCRMLFTTPIFTSSLCIPKGREIRAMAVPVLQIFITWTHGWLQKSNCGLDMRETAL